jgi:hypothetical protein
MIASPKRRKHGHRRLRYPIRTIADAVISRSVKGKRRVTQAWQKWPIENGPNDGPVDNTIRIGEVSAGTTVILVSQDISES